MSTTETETETCEEQGHLWVLWSYYCQRCGMEEPNVIDRDDGAEW